MARLTEATDEIQFVITRGDLARFLYPIRADLTRIDHRLDKIEAKLDRLRPQRRARIVSLPRRAAPR